ncbi:DNA alkylation repair protein [Pedobacter arcticus]|uniref:DNA alkylation repair protein n=1 Tax=Pedobacter arcticus TaxID=752140 RepID=UPI0002E33C79|nr:DNA alkylation repair protein [Pedobacter arcticus]
MTEKASTLTAEQFLTQLSAFQTTAELENVQRFFRHEGLEHKFSGARMANIFALAKQFTQMPLNEIEILLENDYYEARMATVSRMDFQVRAIQNHSTFNGLVNNYLHKKSMVDTKSIY